MIALENSIVQLIRVVADNQHIQNSKLTFEHDSQIMPSDN